MTYAATLDTTTQRALHKRGVGAGALAKLLDCTEQHARDLLDDHAFPTARELAVMRLCANVVGKRLASILAQMTDDYEWRRIPGFDRYEASELGQIRRATAGHGSMPGHVLRPRTSKTGHLRVNIAADGGVVRGFSVHRAVCLAFHGQPPSPLHVVCHKNDKPADNRAENLYWGTQLENAKDRMRNALGARIGTDLTQGAEPTMRQIRKSHKIQMAYRLSRMA